VKKLSLLWFILLFVFASVVFAQEETVVQMRGNIIDNLCAGTQSAESLSKFVATHAKECALAPQCAASGYAIFDGSRIFKFDQRSNAIVETFLKNDKSKLAVVVSVKKEKDNTLSLVSISNQ